MAARHGGGSKGEAGSPSVLDKCSPREDAEFGRMIEWLQRYGQEAHTSKGQTLIIKPRRGGKRLAMRIYDEASEVPKDILTRLPKP